MTSGQGLQGSVDDGLSALAVEQLGYCDAGFARANGTLGAGVKVAKRAAAHGGRLAMESTGHDVTTFVDHEVLSCGRRRVPPSLPGVFGTNWLFSILWRQGSGVSRLF